MAVRVTSEDANDGFKPTCGTIEELSFNPSPDVWGYFSVKSGGGIHEYSDSQVSLSSVCGSPLASWVIAQISVIGWGLPWMPHRGDECGALAT